jgi:cell division protein FtsB
VDEGAVNNEEVVPGDEDTELEREDVRGLLRCVVYEVKKSNEITREGHKLAKENHKRHLWLSLGLFFCLGLLVLAIGLLNRVVSQVTELQRDVEWSQGQIAELRKASDSTNKSVEAVKEKTESIIEEKKTETKVEILKETDPQKPPLKVRITPPGAARVTASAYELPLPVKDVKAVASGSASPAPSDTTTP